MCDLMEVTFTKSSCRRYDVNMDIVYTQFSVILIIYRLIIRVELM